MFKHYIITTTMGSYSGYLKHRPDLETDNWHYYEKESGELIHFRKKYMVIVDETTIGEYSEKYIKFLINKELRKEISTSRLKRTLFKNLWFS